MFTIYDYVKYYKNITINSANWNIMDNLICAILVYLPIKGFRASLTIDELIKNINKLQIKDDVSAMGPKALGILMLLENSERYRNMRLFNFINERSEQTQFGAVNFRINNITIVSYKGTDGTLIGWLENFRISYQYPTYTQKMALDYLTKNISLLHDNNIYVVGHSKGGNLAMSSAMECSRGIYNHIKGICNFDGPGFREKEYNSHKYDLMKRKLINILPTGSVVGVIMNNRDYTFVKSKAIAIDEHYPTSWNLFGQVFIEGEESSVSKQLHESTTSGIKELDQKILEETFETLFKTLGKKYTSNFKLTFEDIRNIYKNMKDIDPKIAKYLGKIIDAMMGISLKKNKV